MQLKFVILPILFFLCFVFCCDLYAQREIALNDALVLLESQNIDMKRSKIQSLIAQQEIQDARNNRIPTLGFDVNHNYYYGLVFDQIAGQLITGNQWTNSANANLSLSVTVFEGFSITNQIKNAVIRWETSRLDIEQMRRSLKLELLSRFFTTLANLELYNSSQKQLRFSQQLLAQQSEQFSIGTNTKVDISLARSQVSTDEQNVITSKNAYENSLIDLKLLLDLNFDDNIYLTVPDMETDIEVDLQKVDSALSRDPVIRKADLELEQDKLELKSIKGRYFPTVRFSGGYGTNYSSERKDVSTGNYMPFGDQFNQNRSLNFGLSLSVPIFDGFQTRSDIKKAKLNINLAEEGIRKSYSERKSILLKAVQEHRKARQELSVKQSQYESLKDAFEAMKLRQDIGVANAVEFGKSLLDMNVAEAEVVRAKYMLLYNREVVKMFFDET